MGEGTLINPKTDKKIDRGLRKAALSKSSDRVKKSLKTLMNRKKNSAQDPSGIKKYSKGANITDNEQFN